MNVGGQPRKTLVRPERNGYVYVMDRATGEVLSATPYAVVNSSKGVDLKTGRLLYNDDKSGPMEAAIYSIVMLLWMPGRQYSGAELASMLGEAGFTGIEIKRSLGLWSVVTARKP